MRATHYFVACFKNGSMLAGGSLGEPDESIFKDAVFYRSWRGKAGQTGQGQASEPHLHIVREAMFQFDKNSETAGEVK